MFYTKCNAHLLWNSSFRRISHKSSKREEVDYFNFYVFFSVCKLARLHSPTFSNIRALLMMVHCKNEVQTEFTLLMTIWFFHEHLVDSTLYPFYIIFCLKVIIWRSKPLLFYALLLNIWPAMYISWK